MPHRSRYRSLTLLLGLVCWSTTSALGQSDTTRTVEGRTIDAFVVHGKNEARTLRQSGLPVSVITLSQLQGTASSIEDVLARTAGITVRQTGGVGSSSRLSVRGLEGKRVGLYIDEQPIGELSDMLSLNDIPLDMIERIEVYKGVVPNKFGGNSLGGAVNVVIKEYPPFYLDGSYEIGSFGTHRLSSVLKRHDKKSGLVFGIGGGLTFAKNDYTMRLHQRQGLSVRREHDRYRKYLAGGSITADDRWGWDRLKLELFYARTYRELQGLTTPIDSAYNHNQTFGGMLLMKRRNFLLEGLDLDNELGGLYTQYGLWDRAMARRDWDGSPLPPMSPHGGEVQLTPSDGQHRSLTFTDKLFLNYTLTANHALTLTAQLFHTSLRPRDDYQRQRLGYEVDRPGRVTSATIGLGHEAYAFDRKLLSSFVGRWYYYRSRSEVPLFYGAKDYRSEAAERSDWGISEALRYQFHPNLLVKASAAWELRLPGSQELLGNGYNVISSPSLRPERNVAVNLGLLYQRSYAYGRTELELNGFYNELRDMSRLVPALGSAVQYLNFGQMRSFGVEAEVKSDLTPWLYVYANATLQDLRDARRYEYNSSRPNPTEGMRMPNVPYLMGNAGLELHARDLFGLRASQTRLLADASYVHEYPYDFEVSRLQERKIPTAIHLDLGVEQRFHGGRWTLTAKVKNVLDRELFSEFYQPLPGRSFSLKLRYLLH